MSDKFILSCCSTVDLSYSYLENRHIPVLFYTYVIEGVTYDDDMGRDPQALPRFYQFLREGKLPQTSQINEAQYEEFFESLLQQGDVLHLRYRHHHRQSRRAGHGGRVLLRRRAPGNGLTCE